MVNFKLNKLLIVCLRNRNSIY